ncbi:MAG: SsrA-binding protein SmpB [Pseudomonadota bacterium]
MAAKKKPKKNAPSPLIASNKRARHDFFIEETYEAGLELMGWEVKSLRAGRGHVADAYVQVKDGEAWLFGATITPLLSASTHVVAEPMRPRRLLLHRQEIDRLIGAVDRKGYTLVPLNLHWHRGRVKLDIGLGKGKKLHDKRADTKDRDWQRQKERILKKGAG